MGSFKNVFFKGLVTILPFAVTLYLIIWLFNLLENMVGEGLKSVLPNSLHIPGIGLAGTLIIIFSFGLLLNSFVIERILEHLEERLKKVPFIKAIYSPLRDLMDLFANKEKSGMKGVVLVELSSEIQILGIITRENFSDLGQEESFRNKITVYCPWSYGMGGFTLLVDKEKTKTLDIPIEKAMSLAITGWVKTEKDKSLKKI